MGLDLDPEAWPAPDVVASSYGRGGQENRFAPEDHELDLDAIFSFSLAGQELACLIGLLVWNLWVMSGFRMNPLPEERAPARPREAQVDPRPMPEGFVAEVEETEDLEPTINIEPTEPDPKDPLADLAEQLSKVSYTRVLDRLPGWQFGVVA